MQDVPHGLTNLLCRTGTHPAAPYSCTKVVAREVLEHVCEPEQPLPEMVRVSVDGAQYLSSVPDASSEESPPRSPEYRSL